MYEDDSVDSVEESSTPEAEEVLEDQPEADVETSESEPEEAAEEGDEESETGDEQSEADSESGTVEVDYDGEVYEVPKRIKDAIMATKDYTEKTQSLAEERKSYEAERADFSQYMEASRAQSDKLANLAALDRQLESFNAYDWNAAFDADITAATKLQHQAQMLQSQRDQMVGEISQAEEERKALQHQNMVRTAERTDKALASKVANWGPERKAELGKFAVETLGIPAAMVQNAVTEPEIMALHYAEIGFRTTQQVKAKAKADAKPKKAAPSVKLKAKRQSPPKSLSTVSDPAQYREMRLAQKRKKAG